MKKWLEDASSTPAVSFPFYSSDVLPVTRLARGNFFHIIRLAIKIPYHEADGLNHNLLVSCNFVLTSLNAQNVKCNFIDDCGNGMDEKSCPNPNNLTIVKPIEKVIGIRKCKIRKYDHQLPEPDWYCETQQFLAASWGCSFLVRKKGEMINLTIQLTGQRTATIQNILVN